MTFSQLVIVVALLALASGVVGLLCGRYLWPRYLPPNPSTTSADPHDLDPVLSDLEERLHASETQLAQLRLAVAQVADEQGEVAQPQADQAGPEAPHRLTS
jgi:hypothetical protein